MKHVTIANLPKKQIAPGIALSSVHLDTCMVTFVEIGEGGVVPEHSHPHEQISVVISGKLEFSVDGEKKTVSAGEAVLVPSNASHGAIAVGGPCVVYDSWSPVRRDYIIHE